MYTPNPYLISSSFRISRKREMPKIISSSSLWVTMSFLIWKFYCSDEHWANCLLYFSFERLHMYGQFSKPFFSSSVLSLWRISFLFGNLPYFFMTVWCSSIFFNDIFAHFSTSVPSRSFAYLWKKSFHSLLFNSIHLTLVCLKELIAFDTTDEFSFQNSTSK